MRSCPCRDSCSRAGTLARGRVRLILILEQPLLASPSFYRPLARAPSSNRAPTHAGPLASLAAMSQEIEYSEKYADDEFEYRCSAPPRRRPPAPRRLKHALRMGCTLVHAFAPSLLRSHVILPKHIAKTAPKGRLLTDTEWRGIGVQQSRGWVHYSIHRCPPPAGSPLPCVMRHLVARSEPGAASPISLSHEPPGRTL